MLHSNWKKYVLPISLVFFFSVALIVNKTQKRKQRNLKNWRIEKKLTSKKRKKTLNDKRKKKGVKEFRKNISCLRNKKNEKKNTQEIQTKMCQKSWLVEKNEEKKKWQKYLTFLSLFYFLFLQFTVMVTGMASGCALYS